MDEMCRLRGYRWQISIKYLRNITRPMVVIVNGVEVFGDGHDCASIAETIGLKSCLPGDDEPCCMLAPRSKVQKVATFLSM